MGARVYKKELRCYYNGNDTVFAYDEEDASKVLDEDYGEGYTCEEDEYEEKTDLTQKYILYQEETKDGYLEPKNSTIIWEDKYARKTEASLKNWMKVVGRGLLGSEQY